MGTPPAGPAAALYARTGPEGDEPDPLERQLEALRGYAAFRGLAVAETFTDPDTPGSIPLEARAGGEGLTRFLSAPHPGGAAVVTARLEHLFASATECLAHLEEWEPAGVALHVLDLGGAPLDFSSPAAGLVKATLAAARAMELEQHQRPSLRSLHKRKRGVKPLLGERVVRGYIVPDPVEAHAVERIQELAAQGKSLRLIADALDQEGVPTKRRASAWSKEAIRLILARIERGEARALRGAEPVDQEQST